MIYGSDLATVRKLRDKDGKGALLKTSFYKGRERLPKGDPNLCVSETPDRYCAMAGRSAPLCSGYEGYVVWRRVRRGHVNTPPVVNER